MKKCEHSESRLTCVDCGKTICPNCMVMCAVGNRCKDCTKGFESHITKIGPLLALKVVVLSFVASIAIFLSYYAVMMIPVVGCMLKELAGGACAYFYGKYIHQASGYKFGMKLLPLVLIPIIIGLSVNPVASPFPYLIMVLLGEMEFNPELLFHLMILPTIAIVAVSIPLTQLRGR